MKSAKQVQYQQKPQWHGVCTEETAAQQTDDLEVIWVICAWCTKSCGDSGHWLHLDVEILNELCVVLSHGICPTCASSVRASCL